MERRPENSPETRANPLITLLIVVGAVALIAVLILLARAPGKRTGDTRIGYRPPPVASGINPADDDAIAVLRLALESDDPKVTLKATGRLAYLAIPELKEGMLALKERGLVWDYILTLPELHHLGYERAEEDLSEYLGAADLQMVLSALDALERMPPLSCRDAFVDCLRQPHMDMAIGGAKVLRKWRKSDDEINQILLNIMRNAPVDFSQIAAAGALYDLGVEREEAWAKLSYWSENADMELAPSLVTFLKQSGDPRAGETIALMLDRPSTRVAALKGLVNLKWRGKLEAIDRYKEEATLAESYLVMVNHEATEGRSELDSVISKILDQSREEGEADASPDQQAEENQEEAPGDGDKPLSDTQRLAMLNDLVHALREWKSARALPYLERIVQDAPRVLRMEVGRALRHYAGERKAVGMALKLLKGAEDERELSEHATTLGFIDSGRSVATLHELMVNTDNEDTKLTLAWAIVNINRNHPHRYPRR
jgi:hypothetical protein